MLTKVRCPICGTVRTHLLSKIETVEKINRLLCRCCGLIFFEKKPKEDSIYNLDYNKHFHRPGDIRKAGIMAAKVAEIANDNFTVPRILEVGPGNGLTSYLLQVMHFHVIAAEKDEETAYYIKDKLKVPAVCIDFEHTGFCCFFDMIYAGHVIEHSWEPLTFLRAAHRTLSPGGILFLDTPNNHYFKKHGTAWKHMRTRQPFEHCSLFGIRTIEQAAFRTGFKVVSIETLPEFENMHVTLKKGLGRAIDS